GNGLLKNGSVRTNGRFRLGNLVENSTLLRSERKKPNTSKMKAGLRAGRVGLGRMQPLTDQFVWNLTKGLDFSNGRSVAPLRRPILESDLSAKVGSCANPDDFFSSKSTRAGSDFVSP
ncbi:MAG TPA: hypothetical protein VNO24_16895, partial [Blastocatellia bacterium]|nr:hypothetical protein [Blastocatellia bacterium]